MKNKILIYFSIFLLSSLIIPLALAQNNTYSDDPKFRELKNVIKLDLVSACALPFGNNIWKIEYERSVKLKHSIVALVSAGSYGYDFRSFTSNGISVKERYWFPGFTLQGQYRYYLINKKTISPRGLYTGVQVKYLQINGTYKKDSLNSNITTQRTIFSYIGLGPVIGHQGLIAQRLSLNITVGPIFKLFNKDRNPLPDNKWDFPLIYPEIFFGIGYAFGREKHN